MNKRSQDDAAAASEIKLCGKYSLASHIQGRTEKLLTQNNKIVFALDLHGKLQIL
jgi:hypothetical protein